MHYQFDPVQTTKTSVHGAINMLGLAKRTRAKMFQASTSEVYGDPRQHPQTEDYWGNVNPIGPRSCYDEGKRCAETLCFDYHRQHGLRIKVARIFNTYGPRMHPNDGRVVSNFIVQALKGEPITLYGDGSQTRSFCYVDDLIEGFLRLMASPDDVTGPINLGNPGEFTIRELAEKVIALTGSRSALVHRPLPENDPTQRQPDIARAQGDARLGADRRARGGAEEDDRLFRRRCSPVGPRPSARRRRPPLQPGLRQRAGGSRRARSRGRYISATRARSAASRRIGGGRAVPRGVARVRGRRPRGRGGRRGRRSPPARVSNFPTKSTSEVAVPVAAGADCGALR